MTQSDPEPIFSEAEAGEGIGVANRKTIGEYEVVRPLGRGGQGEVYLVLDPKLRKRWVVKIGRRALGPDSPEREQLEQEARTLAHLDHPNLVRVIRLADHDGWPFLVREYVAGETLQESAGKNPPSPRGAARLVRHLAGAVEYLHDNGVIHQDIKPSNVLIEKGGRLRLIDFGLSLRRDLWSDEASGRVGGTPAQISPEQAAGDRELVGPETDVFGLGAVLYFLLTGRSLYQGAGKAEALERARGAAITPPRSIAPKVPIALERVCLKALAAGPERRYRSAGELRRALGFFLLRRWALISLASASVIVAAVGMARSLKGPVATSPVRVVRLDIKRWPIAGGRSPVVPVVLGERSYEVRPGDAVTVEAELSEPGYAYVIAFRPDGIDEICDPENADAPPSRTKTPRYGSGAEGFGFDEGPGLYAFAVVASREPLPAYKTWMARRTPRGDGPAVPLWGEHREASPGVVWWFDGQFLVPRARDRGVGVNLPGPGPVVEQLGDRLRKIPGVDDVQIKAITVPAAEPPH